MKTLTKIPPIAFAVLCFAFGAQAQRSMNTATSTAKIRATHNGPRTTLTLLVPDTVQMCYGDSVWLVAQAQNGHIQWQAASQKGDSISVKVPGTYHAQAIDKSGKVGQTDSVFVDVIYTPLTFIQGHTNYCAGDFLELWSTSGSVTYQWDGPGGFTSQDSLVTILNLQPEQSGFYKLTTHLHNCSSETDSLYINIRPFKSCSIRHAAHLLPDAVLPGIFSPNNDGKNDVYQPLKTEKQILSVDIYNEWSTFVYHFEGNQGNWPGTLSNGQPAPAGTYHYIAKVKEEDGKTRTLEGSFKLLR